MAFKRGRGSSLEHFYVSISHSRIIHHSVDFILLGLHLFYIHPPIGGHDCASSANFLNVLDLTFLFFHLYYYHIVEASVCILSEWISADKIIRPFLFLVDSNLCLLQY